MVTSDALDAAVRVLRGRGVVAPEALVVAGSGLGGVAEGMERTVEVPFRELPGLPATGVEGHAGRFVSGTLAGGEVLVQSGRFHVYEGVSFEALVLPVRMAARLGARLLVLTNAAGGIRPDLEPGSIMVLDDQINVTFRSPLVGPPTPGELRFPDMSAPFDPSLQELALRAGHARNVRLFRGTYAGVVGPSYETRAEIRMLARMGADAVGMSTVPEVLTARALGLRVLGLSLITNRATGRGGPGPSHREVVRAAEEGGRRVSGVVRGVLPELFS